MAKAADIKSSKELEQLLCEYVKQTQQLCRLYDIPLKSNKGQKNRMKAAAKELDLLMKTAKTESFDVSSIPAIIESGTEMIKTIIQVVENDSDVVQPCCARDKPRDLCDAEKKSISSDIKKNNHKMMKFRNYLQINQKTFPAIQELFQGQIFKLRTAYNKMGIDTKGCEACAALEDDSEWQVKIPSKVTTDANIKYSVSSSAGQHECSETGLRWRSDSDVSLEYRFVEWESLSKDVMMNYTPCGPLMDITVTSGTLEEIQLPHFVCIDSVSLSDDAVKALHVKDGTVSLERCELRRFHAKIVNPTFSLLAVIALVPQYLTMKFHCKTLVYGNRRGGLNLHVYLIVNDQTLEEVVEKDEKENIKLLKSLPNEPQKIFSYYTLKTSCDSKIKPLELKLTPCIANFFDVYVEDAKQYFELQIMTKKDEQIWDVDIRPDDLSQRVSSVEADTALKQERCKNDHGAEFVDKHMAQLIQKVSLVEPIADDMKHLIGDEKYQTILNSGKRQAQMRRLLDFLTTSTLKEKLYQSLVTHERLLVDELEQLRGVTSH